MNLVNLLSHFKYVDRIVLCIPEEVNIKTYIYEFEFGYLDYIDRFVDHWFLDMDDIEGLTLHVNLCVK